jgi:poly(3-hydroxybutyrate) depolymerase
MEDDTDATATGRRFAERFLDGRFDACTAMLADAGPDAVVDGVPEAFREPGTDARDALEAYWWGLRCRYGDPDAVASVTADGATVAVTLTFAHGAETANVTVDGDGVAGFAFDPAEPTPAYATRSAFEERAVTVDAGDAALEGVLAMPGDAPDPVPGVVLVHGAGVHDPDGTTGASKLLRDIAWGLASEGVASLRYEKRLASHAVPDDAFTLDRVVVDDAVAALERLATVAGVDADALFIAGHSQGGMAAPRIAERHGGLAGLVNLDGAADPGLDPEHTDVIRYEFDPEGDLDADQEARLAADRATLARIASGDFDDDETLHGRPGVWHRSLNAYDPAATARDLDVPAFVACTLGADTDRQPPVADFLQDRYEDWRATDLPDGSSVVGYDHLDHHLQPTHGPSTPLASYFGGTVDEGVVADVTDWLHAVAGD